MQMDLKVDGWNRSTNQTMDSGKSLQESSMVILSLTKVRFHFHASALTLYWTLFKQIFSFWNHFESCKLTGNFLKYSYRHNIHQCHIYSYIILFSILFILFIYFYKIHLFWFLLFVFTKGLQTSQDARFYALSSRFDPVSNEGKPLVIQFTVKHEQKIDCGGGYVKIFPADLDQADMHGESQYYIMFGKQWWCSSMTLTISLLHLCEDHINLIVHNHFMYRSEIYSFFEMKDYEHAWFVHNFALTRSWHLRL